MMGAELSEEPMRAALYLLISTTDGLTTANQRLALAKFAGYRGWEIVQTYEDAGLSGASGARAAPRVQPDAQGRRATPVRRVHVLIDQQARQERPTPRQRHGRTGCC